MGRGKIPRTTKWKGREKKRCAEEKCKKRGKFKMPDGKLYCRIHWVKHC